jgi:hypothetical protein
MSSVRVHAPKIRKVKPQKIQVPSTEIIDIQCIFSKRVRKENPDKKARLSHPF